MREELRQGIEQGRAEERALLRRMTASRFGAEAAVLAEVTDAERLCEVGE